jgi:hypothetical protein
LWQSNICSYVLCSPVFLLVAIKHLFICSSHCCLFTCGNQTIVHMFFPVLSFYLWQSNICSYVLPSPVFLPVAITHLFICSSQSCLFTCGNKTFVHMFFPVLSCYLWQSNICSYVLPSPVFLPVAIKHLFICSSQSCLFTCGNQTFVHVLPSPVFLPVAIKHLFICFYLWQSNICSYVLPSPVFVPVCGNQ